ncbi:MAG: dTDP-4-dehydrorhamnose reductase [Bacteroidales bacterium]|nr:dTDP-4-dehydrorhamnose reductase [Bacteroidales bacterium]
MKKGILITGANGQLGNALRLLSDDFRGFEWHFTDKDELDITNLSDVESYFNKHKIDYIINCAAYTAVDKAESDAQMAELLNAKAVEYLVLASNLQQSRLIHISTDYVFGGTHFLPLTEELPTQPESAYGLSKLNGELFAQKSQRAIIIRTSWLYSEFGHNFVKTIQKYATERGTLNVVFDQVGTPTYASDLAKAIMIIINTIDISTDFNQYGNYHFANEGVASWYDFAVEICKMSDIKADILPVLSDAFPTPAKRPSYSVLDKQKIKTTFGIRIPYWKDSLKLCIEKMSANI